MHVITDFRRVHLFDLQPRELSALVDTSTQDTGGTDVWIVVRPVDQGIARLYRRLLYRRGKRAASASTMSEAAAALGLGEAAVAQLEA